MLQNVYHNTGGMSHRVAILVQVNHPSIAAMTFMSHLRGRWASLTLSRKSLYTLQHLHVADACLLDIHRHGLIWDNGKDTVHYGNLSCCVCFALTRTGVCLAD